MFDYACIVILSLITYYAKDYKLLCYFLLFEFVAIRLTYILGFQLTGFLEYEPLYVAYVLIQTFTIAMMLRFQKVDAIFFLILANLGYNTLTIKQLVLSQQGVATLNYYEHYELVCGTIMVLELFYMWRITQDVDGNRRNSDKLDRGSMSNRGSRLFMLRRRMDREGLL